LAYHFSSFVVGIDMRSFRRVPAPREQNFSLSDLLAEKEGKSLP
jgi:hypothetical protein